MIEANELPVLVAELEEPTTSADTGTAQQTTLQASQLAELDRRLRDLEAAIGDLRTVSAAAVKQPNPIGRKTLSAHTGALRSKDGITPTVEAAGLNAALGSLSIEQRIAVKAGMLRAGLL